MNNFNQQYDTQEIRRVISVVVVNENSVLSRISGLFSARGYNIDSLTVAPIFETHYSRITIVTTGNSRVIDQITKQLNKLIPVLKVNEHKDFIEKDTVLIKIPSGENLVELDAFVRIHNATIETIDENHIIITATQEPSKIGSFIKVMQRFKPIEIVRSGIVAIEK